MRSYEEYERILELWAELGNKKAIARITGIPRGTVTDCIKRYGSIAGLEAAREQATKSTPDELLRRISEIQEVRCAYAYLLGLYLGDGYINLTKNERSYRVRITLDKQYPDIIQRCMDALQIVFPNNKIGKVNKPGCFDVSCYSKHLPDVFPQHGEGPKHERTIELEDWQQSVVDEFPLEFFRGLYHSDGTRSRNIVKGKDYPRYMFINTSEDILRLFSETCDKLGLHWTTKGANRKHACNLIYISKREDVEYLDRAVGPKS